MSAQPSFQVVLVQPAGYVHSAALAEVIETVVYGLRAMGCQTTFATNQLLVPGPRAVFFGAHLLSDKEAALLPPGTIIYNLEQVDPSSSWCRGPYLDLLRRHQVWDYSTRNIAALASLGVASEVKHVPVGYVPQLTRIPAVDDQDIDVLFYGSVNDRRARVIEGLKRTGLNAQAVFGVYGDQRDTLISRAKVVLNLHYYDTSIFELVRVSYLLANRKAVVAECHPGTEIDPDIAGAVRLATYDGLVEACTELVGDEAARAALGEQGFCKMVARDERAYLAAALAEAPNAA